MTAEHDNDHDRPRGRKAPPILLPVELVFYLPLGALVALAASTENHDIRNATTLVAIGGALVTWLTGNALRCRPPTPRSWHWRGAVHMLATTAAVLSLGYAAIHLTDLTDFVWETVITGADRH